MPDREIRPSGRYEWEQIIRRARLGSIIAGSGRLGANGRPTRGGMTGLTFTAICLGWASYADDKGQKIYPGDATVAVDMETSLQNVAAVRKALLDLGLLQLVRGRRGRRGTEYRLTIPSDLQDRLEVPTPAQHTLAADRLREQSRGKRKATDRPEPPNSGGPVDHPDDDNPGDVGGPADTPEPVDNPNLGGPVDTPEPLSAEAPGGSGGYAQNSSGGSGGSRLGGPVDRSTDHDRTTSTTDHSDTALRTAVTLVGHPQAAQDPLFPVVDEEPEPKPEPSSRCARHPLPAGLRDDGQPRCALCRVDARRTAQPPPHPRLIRDEVA